MGLILLIVILVLVFGGGGGYYGYNRYAAPASAVFWVSFSSCF